MKWGRTLRILYMGYIDGLVQDCSNSSALALELLQSCTKPSMYTYIYCTVKHLEVTEKNVHLCVPGCTQYFCTKHSNNAYSVSEPVL